jgi:ubiquinol-cytochrome c reductase cytochrome b subunit
VAALVIVRLLLWVDDRLGGAPSVRNALRKAFPDHWSFLLGEINAYAFLILVATGTFLALFFDPSSAKIPYAGSYTILRGETVSHAFSSAMALSFDVRGGLLVRQVHHWAALLFVAGIALHMARVFFTGAFRKPREINWVLGMALLTLALLAGFTGYSLPDDLLSGTGLRIADSVLLSVPVIGAEASFLLLNGAYPSQDLLPRLFVAHVYLIPASLAAIMALHLGIVWRQKHSQFRGPGRTERNVVGSPLMPHYALRTATLFLCVAAVLTGLGALVQINPVWLWGPYEPWLVVSPAQPDWYIGWVEGAMRIGPPFALHVMGHTVPSPFWPAVLMPTLLLGLLLLWPWIEARLRHDEEYHQLLDFPRDVPLRTAFGAALVAFVGSLVLAGSDDVQARYLHVSVATLTQVYRAFCLLLPFITFGVTYVAARELKARGGVRRAPRVRLRRNARGGFDEESIE